MDLAEISSYSVIISASLIIIVSFFFSTIANRTNIPSVLLLIVLGILLKEGMELFGVPEVNLFPVLEILGIVGLIMIVLEASLELELTRDKRKVIFKSLIVALIALLASSYLIALIIQVFLKTDLFNALVYAIPLSIMSSAIIIPSVASLEKDKEEFMVYESTFSDILGIMFFYFLLGSVYQEGAAEISFSIIWNILITVVVSVAISYLLIFLFQKLQSQVKLFLLIAVLVLLYAIGKMLHFSSLIMILIFGLILNNRHIFFKGKLNRMINPKATQKIYNNFHIITLETSFVVRTFFFVVFGMTIVLNSLYNLNVIVISILILGILFGVRYLVLKLFLRKDIFPQVLIAPRGLITILLFFGIPAEYQIAEFDSGILLFTIIISSIIMAYALIKSGFKKGITEQGPEFEIVQTTNEETIEKSD
jgi:NhaP-type Na+/H+ or K+/H+ antiporter